VNAPVQSLLILPDSRILIAGSFGWIDGVKRF
jgi:hypothetical protein